MRRLRGEGRRCTRARCLANGAKTSRRVAASRMTYCERKGLSSLLMTHRGEEEEEEEEEERREVLGLAAGELSSGREAEATVEMERQG